MSRKLVLEISDQIFAAIQEPANQESQTLAEWLIKSIERLVDQPQPGTNGGATRAQFGVPDSTLVL